MTGSFLAGLQVLVAQEASLPAVRVVVFLWALAGSLAWSKGKARLAVLLFAIGAAVGLSYWLIQIRTPYGLGTDEALTRQWSQAGIGAAGNSGGGFVAGTRAEVSVPSLLTSIGVPVTIAQGLPQISAGLLVVVLAVLPFLALRNRATASFAGALLLAGGLWPGHSPFDWILQNPTGSLAAFLGVMAMAVATRWPRVGRLLRKYRLGIISVLIGAAVLVESTTLLFGATLLLASPLRVALRRSGRAANRVRRLEALVLLVTAGGSGLLWWLPPHSVPGFEAARDPGTSLQRPLAWIRLNVPTGDVILASPEYSAALAALGGRRVLFWPPGLGDNETLPEPSRRARLYSRTLRGQPVARLAEEFSATHLFLGPGEPNPVVPSDPLNEPTLALVEVYSDVEDFRVFRLTKK